MGDQHITESDDEDVPSYGFPSQQKRRNRRNVSDIDLLISNGGEYDFRSKFFCFFYSTTFAPIGFR